MKRRGFLKMLGIGAAVLVVPPTALPSLPKQDLVLMYRECAQCDWANHFLASDGMPLTCYHCGAIGTLQRPFNTSLEHQYWRSGPKPCKAALNDKKRGGA